MVHYYLRTGRLHKKTETKRLSTIPPNYESRFYKTLDDPLNKSFDTCFQRDVLSKAPSKDVKKYLLATSDFGKGMQDDINMYVNRDRLNNASFRQKLNPIAKNIFKRQNPLELVFKDISTFDAQNPIIEILFREMDVGKKATSINSIPTSTDKFSTTGKLSRSKFTTSGFASRFISTYATSTSVISTD